MNNLINGMVGKFVLIEWPYSQDLMDKEWFEEECYLATDHSVGSSYFVPEERLNQLS